LQSGTREIVIGRPSKFDHRAGIIGLFRWHSGKMKPQWTAIEFTVEKTYSFDFIAP
jgi:hypothetical protein